jgi:colicin import membrane protein
LYSPPAAKTADEAAAAEDGSAVAEAAAQPPAAAAAESKEDTVEEVDVMAIIAAEKATSVSDFDAWQTRFAGEWTDLWGEREAFRNSVEQVAAAACDGALEATLSAAKSAEELTGKTFDAELKKLIETAEKEAAAREKAAEAARKEAEKQAAADAKAAAAEAKKQAAAEAKAAKKK